MKIKKILKYLSLALSLENTWISIRNLIIEKIRLIANVSLLTNKNLLSVMKAGKHLEQLKIVWFYSFIYFFFVHFIRISRLLFVKIEKTYNNNKKKLARATYINMTMCTLPFIGGADYRRSDCKFENTKTVFWKKCDLILFLWLIVSFSFTFSKFLT